jgi:heme-degrading monooxygenase HmoA
MHARLLRMEVVTDRVRDVEEIFGRDIIPLCQKQDGFRGAYLLKDPRSGECVAITFWKDEAAMLANERSHFFQEQVAKLLRFYTAVPVRETYEVAVEDEAG